MEATPLNPAVEIVPPGVEDLGLDRKTLRAFMRRSDGPALWRLALCVGALAMLAWAYRTAFGHWWFVPTLMVFGAAMSLTLYSLSHECSHGTVFRSRWLNETVFWVTSVLFGQEVLYRRYSHAAHHSFTMMVGKDAQLPFTQPIRLSDYALWYSGFLYHTQFLKVLVFHSLGRFSDKTRAFTPREELSRMVRNSRIFVLMYVSAGLFSWYAGSTLILWLWLVPKLVGDPVMLAYAASQHFEKEENVADLRRSTRSLKPNVVIDLFYWNMSYHIEHHIYPMVPFFALPTLNAAIRQHLPAPHGIVHATGEILRGWSARSLRKLAPG